MIISLIFLLKAKLYHAIGKSLDIKADKEIDASGKLVFPGGIDPMFIWICPLWELSPAILMKQEPGQPYLVAQQR